MRPTTFFECLILALPGSDSSRLLRAAAKADAVPLLPVRAGSLAEALKAAREGGLASFGLSLGSAADLSALGVEVPGGLSVVVAPAAIHAAAESALATLRGRGVRVLCEATVYDEATLGLPVDGFVLKGHECGGLVSETTTFVLLQQFRRATDLPLLVRGGVTPESAAAARVGGASGVVLDDQVLLLAESPLADKALRRRIEHFSGSETLQVELGDGRYLRGFAAAGTKAEPALRERLREEFPEAIAEGFTWAPGGIAPAGQGLVLARPLAARYRTLGRLVGAIRRAVEVLPARAAQRAALAEGSALAKTLGTRYPILQGPMTRVSDVSDFFLRVAEQGALPFAALALLSGEATEKLLIQTRDLLGDRPWGVGLLGFADTKILKPQIEAVDKARPNFAIIAGGRINQVLDFEKKGIPAFVHASTPGLITHYLEEGVRRFVVEGRECGGHVGPMSSFALWSSIVEALRDHPVLAREGRKVQVVFAGGIHDRASAAMAATLAEPLAEQGVQIGVLMGTSYLFTREIVESGAIVPDYQEVALATSETRCLWEGPGFASRVAMTPIVEEFATARQDLEARGASVGEVRETLEHFSLGRLRMATKGVMRMGPEKALTEVGPEERRQRGMYMIGQVAVFHDEVRTIAELHEEVSAGSVAYLAERAQDLAEAARPETPAPADIAIIGMATLLPGSDTLQAYWRRILKGESAIGPVPEDRWSLAGYFDADRETRDKVYSQRGGFLGDVAFNPMDYGIPPTSVPAIDPMQLLALELVSDALKDATLGATEPADHSRTSVMFGFSGGMGEKGIQYATRAELPRLIGQPPEEILSKLPEWTEDSFAGILPNVAAGRVANRFNFGGTNVTVDAACASSLAAIYAAVMELESGRSDLAVAGGIDSLQSPFGYLCFSKTQALSPRGVCNTFDKKADGIVISEGMAAVVLKRLADAERDGDRIYAVIKGVGASSDGRAKGLTAPLPAGQKRALERAYNQAGFDPATVGLFEAHGTGTVAGDRAELETVTGALRAAGAGPQNSAIGSVKTLIGHTKASAGVAGLVKVALGLHQKVLPPHALVDDPNPVFEDREGPLSLSQVPRPWIATPDRPRRAGVSSFGFGGTNFHVALEEYRDPHAPAPLADPGIDVVPFAFAAASRAALRERVATIAGIAEGLSLHDLAGRALSQTGTGPARLAFTAATREEALAKLGKALDFLGSEAARAPEGLHWSESPRLLNGGKLAFVFPGQGSQYPGMLRQTALLHPAMTAAMDETEAALAEAPTFGGRGRRLSQLLYPGDAFTAADRKRQMAELTATDVAQPALGAVEAGMVATLAALGLRPDMTAGHSYGEFVALHAAGAFGVADLIRLSEARGRAIVANGDPARPGAMAAVAADAEATRAAIRDVPEVVVANLNSPRQTIIAGPKEAIQRATAAAEAAALQVTPVPVSQAFHSPLMAAAREEFDRALAATAWTATSLPVFSNTLAARHDPDPDAQRRVMGEHLVSPVDFVGMARAMAHDGAAVFVEVGPKSVLSNRLAEILGEGVRAVALDRASGDAASFVDGLAQLFVEGAEVDLGLLLSGLSEVLPRAQGNQRGAWLLNGAYARPMGAPRRDMSLPARPLVGEASDLPEVAPSAALVPSPTAPALARVFHQPKEELIFVSIQEQDLRRSSAPVGAPTSALSDFHGMMVEFLRVQESVMLAYLGSGASAQPALHLAAPLPPLAIPQAVGVAPVAAPAPVATPVPAPVVAASASVAPVVSPAPQPAPAPVAAAPARVELPRSLDLMGAFISIVADKTGYPSDALDPDQGMEADLGIDSIKRMEILGAVQKILPDAAAERMRAEMDALAELSTMREIVDFIQARMTDADAPAAAGADARPFDQTGGDQADAGVLPRFVQVPHQETADHLTERLPQGLRVVVTESEDGFHEPVLAALAQAGAEPILLPRDVLGTEALGEWVASLPGEGAIGLIHLDGRAAMPELGDLDLAGWRAVHARETKSFFALLQALSPRLRDGGRVVCAMETGGLFGRVVDEAPQGLSAAAGVLGIVKALALEWRECSSKVIDLDPREGADAKARHLVHELSFLRGRREAGYPGGLRTILRTEPAALTPPAEPPVLPDSDWVVLATGGARGITAECLRTIAPFGPRLVLVGRSPEPAHEGPETAGLDLAGLRRHFLDAARAAGEKIRPAEIEGRVARLLALREMRTNLDDLARLGATVDYRVADVADEKAMRALIDDLYASFGRMDLVVHGAGLIEDALLEAKSAASFDRVFDTKVDSAFLLARHLRPETLKGLCFFTSVAGRYGNRGQTDYAAANETLNRLAWALRREWGPRVAVKAINWGPWGATTTGAGMVTEAVARQFAARGIGLVEAGAGADLFFKEMFWSPATQVESVGWSADGETMEETACGLPPLPGQAPLRTEGLVLLRNARRAEGPGNVLLWRFDLVDAPFVDHHRFGGNPVMPMAAMMQMASEVPRAFGIDRPVIALEGFQMLKGLTLEKGPFEVQIELADEAADGRRRVNIRAAQDMKRVWYRADLRFGDVVPHSSARPPAPVGTPWTGPSVPEIYRRWLSHGPRFQTLIEVTEVVPTHTLTRAVATRPEDFVPVEPGQSWNFDPGLIDGSLQAVWIWSRVVQGASTLPIQAEAIRRFDGDPAKGPCTVHTAILSAPNDPSILSTIRIHDADGVPVLEFEQFRGQSSRQLNRLSGGWQGGVRPDDDLLEAAQ